MKTAICNADARKLPIGDKATLPDRPSSDVVEMVFGLRQVTAPIGLWGLAGKGDTFNPSSDFEFLYLEKRPEDAARQAFVASCVSTFRGALRFLINFDSTATFVPGQKITKVPGVHRELVMMRPLQTVHHAGAELFLSFAWE